MHTVGRRTVGRTRSTYAALEDQTLQTEYNEAEENFAALIKTDCLDEFVRGRPPAVRLFEHGLEKAITAISAVGANSVKRRGNHSDESARLFLQRVLYRINRLKLFWYDDLKNYDNERSSYLHQVRDRVERTWQAWELSLLDAVALRRENAREALLCRAAQDVSPPPSASSLYFRHQISEVGYRRLLAIASLDGLVEASQLSRTLGGVSNDIHSMMTRVLVEEYGGGKLNLKHSTFFTAMLTELEMRTEPEAYYDLVPWEVLAAINHSFLLSERKRFYLRYVGGLLYTEISVPAAFDNYRTAAERLDMSQAARGYWELHIREDKRHGQWMLYDIALPLAANYPAEAWEITLGYDQQKLISERSGASVARSVRAAELEAAQRQTVGQSAA
jgi:Iron-containing redox enzyme